MLPNEPVAIIPDETFHNVCKPGAGAATCRYIIASGAGIECAKHTAVARVIDQRVAANDFTARGDNCPGLKPGFQAKTA